MPPLVVPMPGYIHRLRNGEHVWVLDVSPGPDYYTATIQRGDPMDAPIETIYTEYFVSNPAFPNVPDYFMPDPALKPSWVIGNTNWGLFSDSLRGAGGQGNYTYLTTGQPLKCWDNATRTWRPITYDPVTKRFIWAP